MGRLLDIVTPLHKATKRDYIGAHDGRQGRLHAEGARSTKSTIGTATAATAMAATGSSRGAGSRWRRR